MTSHRANSATSGVYGPAVGGRRITEISARISSAPLVVFAALVAVWLGQAAFVTTAARAQDKGSATVTSSSNAAVFVGKTPTLSELASDAANIKALRAGVAVMQHSHRLPNGGLTSAPDRETLNALPMVSEPLATTQSATGLPASNISGFVGIYEGDNATVNGSEVEPPDQGLAVNNNVAVEINNNVLQVFNATSGAPLTGPIAASTFFQAPAGTALTDPQVFFDASTQRWFLTEILSNAPIFNGGSGTTEDIAVAVSQTSSATGSYYIYYVRAFSSDLSGCGGQDCLPDYPKSGYDANIFIVDVNLFNASCNSCSVVTAAAFALPKSLLEAGASFTYTRLTFPNDFVVQPSVPAPGEPFVSAANGTEYLMESVGSSTIRVWAVTNTSQIVSNPSSLRANSVDVASENFVGSTVPSTQPNVIGPYCASQGATSAPSLDAGYNAFQATVQKANGNLYGALAYGARDGNGLARDNIAWFVLTPSVNSSGIPSASIAAQGYLTATNGYSLSYPAFALNNTGAGYLGFTETNQSASVVGGYPSASIIQFTGTAITGNILVTGQGSTSDDGFSGCPHPTNGPGRVGRWGDYGAAVVDAATGYFYTANEMIPNPSSYPRGTFANWGTFITQVSTQQTTFTISVSASPPAGGMVSGNGTFPAGSSQTVTATANSGYSFVNWTENGTVVSTSAAYTFTLNADRTLVANFIQVFTLSVGETGSGTVTSSPAGINCGSMCSASFTSGTQVTLTATPAGGWSFTGWGGACSGAGGCVVTMNAAQSVTATFAQITYTLSVSVSGNGAVTSSPAGINCGSTCSASYNSGTPVTLTATPSGGATFSRWTGACSGSGGCTVTMNSSQSVAATFVSGGALSNQTWVSATTGNDANPCSRASPCQTFAGAIAQTSAGGEINCLDAGGFGAAIITKALTINCEATLGSVLASGTNGIVIEAGPADVVTLNGVEFEGVGAGLNAIRFLSGKELHMHKFQIRNFANSGIDIEPSNSARVFLADGYISDCGVGGSGFAAILIKANSGANTSVSINHVQMEDNLNGVFADGSGGGGVAHVQVRDSVVSGSSGNGISISSAGPSATADVVNNTIRYNINAGTVVTGAAAAMKLGGNVITNNVTGVASSGGTLQSFKNNQITDNGVDGIPINAVPGYSGTLQ